MVGQCVMGFLDFGKYSYGWSPLLVHHERFGKKPMGFGLNNIHPLSFIALIEGTIKLY